MNVIQGQKWNHGECRCECKELVLIKKLHVES